jgi:predicted CoA-binding protein
MTNTHTLVLGASSNPNRYSYEAMKTLLSARISFLGVGNRSEVVFDQEIVKEIPNHVFHTVTLYLSAKNQEPYIDTILNMKPERVIFNPGTENDLFKNRLTEKGINFEEACTLVLLRLGKY